jgi:nucleoside-diphosphate-sugar epimerase
MDLSVPGHAQALIEAVRPDAVLHLAGGPTESRTDLYARNVLTSVNVLEAVAAVAEDTRVLLLGSAAEYGRGQAGPLQEDADLDPVNEYGRAKAAQTRLAQAIAERSGLHLSVLRPFNVVAPDLPTTSALGNVRRQLLVPGGDGPRTVVCGRTASHRAFSAVHDVAAAMVRLTARPPGGVLNLCSGRSTTLQEVIDEMSRQHGVGVQVELDPALAAIPAGDSVVGDPSRLNDLGIVLDGSPERVAAAVLGTAAVL